MDIGHVSNVSAVFLSHQETVAGRAAAGDSNCIFRSRRVFRQELGVSGKTAGCQQNTVLAAVVLNVAVLIGDADACDFFLIVIPKQMLGFCIHHDLGAHLLGIFVIEHRDFRRVVTMRSGHGHAGVHHHFDRFHAGSLSHPVMFSSGGAHKCLYQLGVADTVTDFHHVFNEEFFAVDDVFSFLERRSCGCPLSAADSGGSAREAHFFENQNFHAVFCCVAACGKTCTACADNHEIINLIELLRLIFRCSHYGCGACREQTCDTTFD